jgi:hypothetical protein
MPDRVILAVKYTPVSAPTAVRRAVGGFLRYVQYRDKHDDQAPPKEVAGLLKYVEHRDRTGSRARLFDARGPVGDDDRRRLATFVGRSVAASKAQLSRDRDGRLVDRRRAVYRFVLSPEHAEGLDLKELTKAAMARLGDDVGGQLRWLAAEHRNTAHPHVHIVLAGFREQEPDRFRLLVLTKPRLGRMKEALAQEIARQRDQARPPDRAEKPELRAPKSLQVPARTAELMAKPPARPRTRTAPPRTSTVGSRRKGFRDRRHPSWIAPLRRLAARYRYQIEQQAAEERWRVELEVRDRG